MLANLQLIGTGFAVVLLVLLLIWAVCAALGMVFARAERRVPPCRRRWRQGCRRTMWRRSPPLWRRPSGTGVRLTRITAPPHRVDGWPLEGRIETYAAHRIRTDWGPTRPTLGGTTPNILRGQHR